MNNPIKKLHRILVLFLSIAILAGTAFQLMADEKKPAQGKTATAEKTTPATEKKPAEEKKQPATSTALSQELVNKRIVENIRAAYNVPPNILLSVVEVAASQLAGLDEATVEVSDGKSISRQQVYLTHDRKYALVGKAMDLTVDPYESNLNKISLNNVPMRGNKNAKVTIVEYSDFQCPFCTQAYRTLENDVMKQYGDKVRLVYKHFPLPTHPWAENAAIASSCAQQQSEDAFWKFYSNFFENQSSINPENFKSKAMDYATETKIDTKKFEDCFDNKRTLPQVKADMAEAQAVGITGTPLFFINGRPLPGVQPFSAFQIVIDEELKKVPN